MEINSTEEEELSEQVVSEFENPDAVNGNDFIQKVVQETATESKEIGNILPVDFDAVECNNGSIESFSYCQMDRMFAISAFSQINSRHPETCPLYITDKQCFGTLDSELHDGSMLEATSPDNCNFDCDPPESPSSDESYDKISVSEENMSRSTSETSFDNAEDNVFVGGPESAPRFDDWDLDDRDHLETVFRPDYLVYDDVYSIDSVLIFSGSSLEIKGSNAKENQGEFYFHWDVGDLVDIQSQWLGRYDTAMVHIQLHSKTAAQDKSTNDNSGIDELRIAVFEPNWYRKLEAIRALHERYSTIWNVVLDTDLEKNGLVQCADSVPKRYFPNFDESFEEIIYPKGDSDAVSISKRDVDLLEPDTFVNDTIIDFYIKYLKNKLPLEERQRFHFFNSFFFRKLADLDKNPSSAFEARIAFQRVRKWTRKVNLFEKDYIFIPVNFNYHWSLIVICHPSEVAKFQDENVEKSLKVPCILHMDSIRGSHTGLKGLVQSYLLEEWKEKQKEISEDISSRFLNLRFLSLELPQQQNTSDCGLFLLHYVERFLEDLPDYFSPFKLTKFSSFLGMDWFPPAEASLKRVVIQRLIYDLLDICSSEASPSSSSGRPCSSGIPKNNYDFDAAPEFLSDRCNPLNFNHGNFPNSHIVQGIELAHLPTPSLRTSQYVNESGLAMAEIFEPGAAAGSLFDPQYQVFTQTMPLNGFNNGMAAAEVVEASCPLVYPTTEAEFEQPNGTTSDDCAFAYSSRDYAVDSSWNEEILVNQAEHENVDLSHETSSVSVNSLEELDENGHVIEEEEIDDEQSPVEENVQCFTSAPNNDMVDAADTEYPVSMFEDDVNQDANSSFQNNTEGISPQNHDFVETNNKCCDLLSVDGDSELQHAAKRMRFSSPDNTEPSGSMS